MRPALGILACALAAAIAAAPVAAQTKTGTTFGAFLLIEPSARIAAMGNAGVTAGEGLDAVYYNPAAISRLASGVHFTHAVWFADIGFDYAAAAVPLGRWGSGFASVTALRSGEMDVRTVAQPLGTGERFSVTDIAIGFGYGRDITDRFSMGIVGTYVQESIWHSSASTAVVSFGTLYQISDRGLRIGASLSHFGTDAAFSGRDLRVTWDADPARNGDNATLPAEQFTDAFGVPVLFRVGLGLPVVLGDGNELRLAVDAAHPNDNTESVSAGAEFLYRRSLALRWGWQNAFQQDAETGLTLGAGLLGEIQRESGGYAYRCDYGWADHGRLGSTHRISLGVSF
jgi:hypothetical protein